MAGKPETLTNQQPGTSMRKLEHYGIAATYLEKAAAYNPNRSGLFAFLPSRQIS